MASRNYERDKREICTFARDYIGKSTGECVFAYAAKRKITDSRAGKSFWEKVDAGKITIEMRDENGMMLYFITGILESGQQSA